MILNRVLLVHILQLEKNKSEGSGKLRKDVRIITRKRLAAMLNRTETSHALKVGLGNPSLRRR